MTNTKKSTGTVKVALLDNSRKALASIISFSLIFSPIVATAQIVPGGGNTNLGPASGADRVPVVNINAPTQGGVSHNKYNQFNVGPEGLILNNMNLRDYSTQYKSALSGEHVEFNRNFGTGNAAKVVINEVVGNSATSMRGYTEIYGHKADYIVANPNGITCAGCGFVNTGRLSLITGSTGDGVNYNMGAGELKIEQNDGFGLYSPNSAELVSNAVKIAGQIQVDGDLAVLSGNDRYNYNTNEVTSKGSAPAAIAIDSAALGGMRANSIRVVATQKGFGVNLGGDVVADMGDIEITADGNIAFKNTYAAKNIRAKSAAGDVALTGGEISAQTLKFDAGRDFRNAADTVSENGISVSAERDFANTGSLSAKDNIDIGAGGSFTNSGDIMVERGLDINAGGAFTNSGDIASANDLNIKAGGNFLNNGSIGTEQCLEVTAAGSFTNNKEITASNRISLAGKDFGNAGDIFAGNTLDIDAKGAFTNSGDLASAENMTVVAGGNFLNSGSIGTEQSLDIAAGGSFTNNKEIIANGAMSLAGSDFINAGDIFSGETLDIVAKGTFRNSSKIESAGDMSLSSWFAFTNTGTIGGGADISLLSEHFTNSGTVTSHGDMSLDTRGTFENKAGGEILVGQDLEIKNTTSFTNSGDMMADGNMAIQTSGNFKNNKNIISGEDMLLKAGGDFAQEVAAYIMAGRNLELTARKVDNKSHIDVGGDAVINAANVNNFGRFLANGNMTFNVSGNLYNLEEAGILAGGDLGFYIGNNMVNGLDAEIYAMGSIIMAGFNGRNASGDRLEVSNIYKDWFANPYINSSYPTMTPPPVVIPDLPNMDEIEGDMDMTLVLADGTKITLPAGKLEDDLGATFETDGFTIVQGIREQSGTKTEPNPNYDADCEDDCAPETIEVPEYAYKPGGMTVLDKDGVEIAFEIDMAVLGENGDGSDIADSGKESPPPLPPSNAPKPEDTALSEYRKSPIGGYDFADSRMVNLINFGGRIEAGKDIKIGAQHLTNAAYIHVIDDKRPEYAIAKEVFNDNTHPCGWQCGWTLMWREYIDPKSVNIGGTQGHIIAGNNLTIKAENVLNNSSVISALKDIAMDVVNLQNTTYNKTVTTREEYKRRDVHWQPRKFRWRQTTTPDTRERVDRVYSTKRAKIAAGGALKIKAVTVSNDQENGDLKGGGMSLSGNGVDKVSGKPDIKLPNGTNGMFVVSPTGLYLVVSNVPFLNPNDFVGGNYLFELLAKQPSSSNFGSEQAKDATFVNANRNTDMPKLLGDPAYETRMIMDEIMRQTGQNFLGGGEVDSAYTQMQKLYNNAADESKNLGLKVGVELSPDQIAALKEDIIWYVELEVGGHKVLVPELYVSQATLAGLNTGNGSMMTGFEIGIEADYVANYGEISAENLLRIDAKEVLNESNDGEVAKMTSGGEIVINAEKVENLSAEIKGDKVTIKAQELINATKVYADEYTRAGGGTSEYWYEERAGETAVISGTSGVKLEVEGLLHNSGADIKSEKGNIDITAGEAIFDTIQLVSSYSSNTKKGKSAILGKENTTSSEENLRNIGSNITAGGSVYITSDSDIDIIGSKVNAGKDVLLTAVNDINIMSAVDIYRSSNNSEKKRFDNTSLSETEEIKLRNQKSSITAGGNFQAIAGHDVNMIGADVTATNGKVLAGNEYRVLSVQDRDYTYHYDQQKRVDWGAYVAQGGLALGALAISVIFPPAAAVAVPIAGSLATSAVYIVVDEKQHRRTVEGTEKETVTQVKSTLNFSNEFYSYSGNNTTVSSSDITAKNPNSRMETGNGSEVIINDAYDISSYEHVSAKYSPYVGSGGRPSHGIPEEPSIASPPMPPLFDDARTPFDEIISSAMDIFSGWIQDGAGFIGGDGLEKLAKKNASPEALEKMAKNLIASGVRKQFVQTDPGPIGSDIVKDENKTLLNRAEDFCKKDCDFKSNIPKTTDTTLVKSEIKFGG